MEAPKRAACDRCRAQKLRCKYDEPSATSCDRCCRAQVACIRSPSLRMGRRPAKKHIQSTEDPQSKENTTEDTTVAPKGFNNSIMGDEEAVSTFVPFEWFADTDGEMFDPIGGDGAKQETCQPVSTSASSRDISVIADLSPISGDYALFGSSLESMLDMSHTHDTAMSIDNFQESIDIAHHCSLATGDHKSASAHGLDGTKPLEIWNGTASHFHVPYQPSTSDHGTQNPVPGISMRQLSEFNLELQDVVSRSEEAAQWLHTQQTDSSSTSTSLIAQILDYSQQYLAILEKFEPMAPQSCLACQRLDPYAARPAAHSNGHTATITAVPRMNTQTLSLVVGCFVHILRLFSNLFGFLSGNLEMHTSPGCSYFPQLFEGSRVQHSPFQRSRHLQAIVLVQTASYLLDMMEVALGCRHLFDTSEISSITSENSYVMSGEPVTRDRVAEYTYDPMRSLREPKSGASLLSRYNSLDLLETMMNHEDMESKEYGRRRLRDLRTDMNRITEALRVV